MQAEAIPIDAPRAHRNEQRTCRRVGAGHARALRRQALELAGTLLLALSLLCAAAGLQRAGSAQAASTQGQAIVNAAAAMHGKAYCEDGGTYTGPTHGYGGSGCGAATKGFDCSGLALYAVFQGTGIKLPHKASEQAVDAGGTVVAAQSALQPGDLVFFGGGSMAKAVHVAIYAGHSEVWVAEDYGIPVRMRTLSWIEHGLRFDGGVRFWSAAAAPTSPAPSAPAAGESGPPTPGASGEPAPHAPTSEAPGESAPPRPTFPETTGSVVHTWTDYADAGGSEGPEIPSNATVQILCKVNGFTVADGNTWWYLIASSPWNGAYYGSADAFYNDGATSGSLLGTPFVDPSVPNC
jgi:cell wall-associated NlpC family hydrolase